MSRLFMNFREALPEIKRDVVEMGIKVFPKTYQDKFVGNDVNFETMELQNYIYTVVHPDAEDLEPTLPWAPEEWTERLLGIRGLPVNPGKAWRLRKEVWSQFLGRDGKFAYTYGERFRLNDQVNKVIERLLRDPDSRQLYIGVWTQSDNTKLGGVSRVPCSLGYQIQCRKGKLNITYLQRSCDLVTHLVNDVYLAYRLQDYIAHEVEADIGTFTHWIGSLHVFRKDSQGVF